MSRRFITHRRPGENVINPVADVAELRMVGVGDVEDRSLIFVESQGHTYYYDYESEEAESGNDVIQPTGGPGRWISTLRSVSGGASEHNELDGLQGGEPDEEFYHLSEEEHSLLTEGVERGGFRLKWSQEKVLEAGESVLIDVGEELILADELDILGELDVQGDLILLPSGDLWRKKWSQETVVASYERAEIGVSEQLIIYNEINVLGDLEVNGDLVVVSLGEGVQEKAEFFSASRFQPVDGQIWNLLYDDSVDRYILQRDAALGDAIIVGDVILPSGNNAIGVRPTAFSLVYEVTTEAASDVVGTLLKIIPPDPDGVGAAVLPTAASLSVDQEFTEIHDTGAERGSIEKHSVLHTLDAPAYLSAREGLRLRANASCAAATQLKFYGAVVHYEETSWP